MAFLDFFKKRDRRDPGVPGPQAEPPATQRPGEEAGVLPDEGNLPAGQSPCTPLAAEAGKEPALSPDPGPFSETAPPQEAAAPLASEKPPGFLDAPPKPLLNKVYFLGGNHEKLNQRLKDELKKMNFSWIDLSATYMETALDEVMKNNPQVFFCVAALSGDEFVYDKSGKPAQARLCSKQDIVFKLGYLIGRHGKSNCFVLYKEQKSFALPTSLIHGIFTVLDDDIRWKDMLRSRLTGSGYTISC